jgi:hypothetical protein
MVGHDDVARGEHARRAGLQPIVDDDPVIDGQPALGREASARRHADPDHDHVAVDDAAVARADALHGGRALERLDPGAEQHPDAVVQMDVAIHRADLATEHAFQRDVVGIDHRDVHAALPSRRRDLGTDPTRTDDDHRAALAQPRSKRIGVGNGAQIEHALERCAGDRQATRLRAGGDQQSVVPQPCAVGERELPGPGIQPRRSETQSELDLVLGVEGLVVHIDRAAPGVAAQIVLRQRRPLVRPLRLGTDEDHAPVEPLLSQGLCGLGAREPGAEDDERLVSIHVVCSIPG